MAELTLQLAAFPERAWSRFAVADAAGNALPSPLKHAMGASCVSVFATAIGWALRPGSTVGGIVLHVLAALIGYAGAALLAVEASARFVQPMATSFSGATSASVARFASGAVLPVVVSGMVNVIPLLPMSFLLALAGAAASAHSGWIGASTMLALEGQPRRRAAAVPAGVAVGLVLLATLARTVLPI